TEVGSCQTSGNPSRHHRPGKRGSDEWFGKRSTADPTGVPGQSSDPRASQGDPDQRFGQWCQHGSAPGYVAEYRQDWNEYLPNRDDERLYLWLASANPRLFRQNRAGWDPDPGN